MEKEIVKVVCPKCKEPFRTYKPTKPGSYKITCPKCQNPIKLVLNAKDIKTATNEENNAQKQQIPILGVVEQIKPGQYGVKNHAKLNVTCGFLCPECKKPIIIKPQKQGINVAHCGKCKTKVSVFADGDTEKPAQEKQEPVKKETDKIVIDKKHQHKGILSWGNIFSRKSRVLNCGKLTIGREDADMPSDISFKDDYMSRQSVSIETSRNEKGYLFKLTVLNASNPVYVNNAAMAVGNSIYLNYGDSIMLGKTVLNFKKYNQ